MKDLSFLLIYLQEIETLKTLYIDEDDILYYIPIDWLDNRIHLKISHTAFYLYHTNSKECVKF